MFTWNPPSCTCNNASNERPRTANYLKIKGVQVQRITSNGNPTADYARQLIFAPHSICFMWRVRWAMFMEEQFSAWPTDLYGWFLRGRKAKVLWVLRIVLAISHGVIWARNFECPRAYHTHTHDRSAKWLRIVVRVCVCVDISYMSGPGSMGTHPMESRAG